MTAYMNAAMRNQTISFAEWVVKFDNGKGNSCRSRPAAEKMARMVTDLGEAAEIWTWDRRKSTWVLVERMEPEMCGCHTPPRPVSSHARAGEQR